MAVHQTVKKTALMLGYADCDCLRLTTIHPIAFFGKAILGDSTE